MFKGKKIKLTPLPPKNQPGSQGQVKKGRDIKGPHKMALHIISLKEFEQEIQGDAMALVAREFSPEFGTKISPEVEPLSFESFNRCFPRTFLMNYLPCVTSNTQ